MEIEDVDEPEDAVTATPANGTVGQVIVGDALPDWGAVPSAATLVPGAAAAQTVQAGAVAQTAALAGAQAGVLVQREGSGETFEQTVPNENAGDRAGGNRHFGPCVTPGCPNRAKTISGGRCGACDGQGFRSSRDNTKLCGAECCRSLPEKDRRPQFALLSDGTPVCKETLKVMQPELLCIACDTNFRDFTCPRHKKCRDCRKIGSVDKVEAIAQLCEEEGIEEAPANFADAKPKKRYAKWNLQDQKAHVFIKKVVEYKRACAMRGCLTAAKSVKVGYCNRHETQMKKAAAA